MASACVDHQLAVHDTRSGQQSGQEIALSLERELDLLVVVDNSHSMKEEQDILTDQFRQLMLALNKLPGGFPNSHIGVVSSDLGAGPFTPDSCEQIGGDRACLQCLAREAGCIPPDNCAANGEGGFIDVTNINGVLDGNFADVWTEDVEDKNGDGRPCIEEVVPGQEGKDACDVAAAFSCIGKLGIRGCGFEQHLEVVKRALETRGEGTCMGSFQRDESLLAILVLADEDDCSAQDDELFSGISPVVATLGPVHSYRCFEFGVDCDQVVPRSATTLTGCEAREDCGPDCYLTPPSQYADFLRALRPERKLLFAVIGGKWNSGDSVQVEVRNSNGEPRATLADLCPPQSEIDPEARPGIRLRAVTDALGEDGVYASDFGADVCSSDYTPALEVLEERIRAELTPGCLPKPLINADGHLIESASEARCTVQQRTGDNSVTLPRCQFANLTNATSDCPPLDESPGNVTNWDSEVRQIGACWHLCDSSSLSQDGGRCPLCSDSSACSWQFRVCRDPQCLSTTLAPPNTRASLRCSTCEPGIPGCLCGDGVCNERLDDTPVSCPEDCDSL